MPAHLLPLSRRRFLAGSAATIAAGPSALIGAGSRVDPSAWALLSDTHLLSADSIQRHYSSSKAEREKRAADASRNLDVAARQVNRARPAGMILNGDCVHVGGRAEYAQLATKFDLFENTPIHVTMGNHDQRDDFSQAFRERTSGDRALLENRHVSIVKSRRANFVLLDSLTMDKPRSPVKGPGILGREQLEWLEAALDSEPDRPIILMFHHNITPSAKYQQRFGKAEVALPSSSPFKGFAGGLEDTEALLDLIRSRPQVKAVVTGHMHQFRIFQWRKIHFISLPAVGYTFHAAEPPGWALMKLGDGGASVELRTLDTNHKRNRAKANLTWS